MAEEGTKEVFKPSPAAATADMYDAVISPDIDFLESMDIDLELIDRIMTSKHTIEGDKPYLSQMIPLVIEAHMAHAEEFSATHPDLCLG